MKRMLLVALVALNLCLLVWVLNVAVPQVHAQAVHGQPDYIAVAARVDGNTDALYIVDTAKRRMLSWKPNAVTKALEIQTGGIELLREFGRDKGNN